jgi:hypothetical protein
LRRKASKRQRDRVLELTGELLELADPATFEILLVPTGDDTVGVTLGDQGVIQPYRVDRGGRVLYLSGEVWVPRCGAGTAAVQTQIEVADG